MDLSTEDFSFFFRKEDKELYVMSRTHVDDIFQAGKDCFRRSVLQCTADIFDSKPPEEDKFVFTGLEIDASSTDCTISQDGNIKRLSFLAMAALLVIFAPCVLGFLGPHTPDQTLHVQSLWQHKLRIVHLKKITSRH
jgi:hypothetical protein